MQPHIVANASGCIKTQVEGHPCYTIGAYCREQITDSAPVQWSPAALSL